MPQIERGRLTGREAGMNHFGRRARVHVRLHRKTTSRLLGVLLSALAALALVALAASVQTGVAAGEATSAQQVSPPVSPPVYPPGTTAVVGESQEPVCLNAYLTCGSLQATLHLTAPILAGAYRVRPDLTYEAVLVSSVDVETKPFTLTYHLKPEAKWSDGVAVTSDDLLFTFNAIHD